MPTLSIPPAIDEILSVASRHHGLSPSLTAGLTSITRSVMRAYVGADVDVSQLIKALERISQCLAAGGKEASSDADAAAYEDLAALARALGRVVDGSVAPGGRGATPVPVAGESPEPSGREPPAPDGIREPGPFTRDVVVEHLDEAGFCRTRWDAALCAPNYTPAEVQEGPEERLRAHLDALVLGGRPVAEQVLVPALDHEDPPTAFAAAWCLLASEEGDFDDAVVEAFAAAGEPRRRELARALALAPSHAPSDRLVQALPSLPPQARAEAARTLTRWFEGSGDIRRWLASDDAPLISGTLRGLRGDLTSWAELLERHLCADDPVIVSAAIRPGLCLGLVDAWDACVEAATGPDPAVEDLIALATLGGAAEHAAVERALQLPGSRRSALFALGFSGRRRAAELCLEIIDGDDRDLAAARVAGEAFSAITGLAIEGVYARRAPADDDAADDDDGVDLAADDGDAPRATPAEAQLPLPDGPAIRGWWSSATSRFHAEQRYLAGAPISAAGLVAAVISGPMRRRPGLVLELAVRTRGAFNVDTADWVSRQRAALATSPVPRIGDFTALFGAGD